MRDATLTGQVIAGRYKIIRRIGEGGMGAVYEAERVTGGRNVAVKTLHPHLANDQEIVTRFKREAIAASSIGDPHIVEVWDSGSLTDGTQYLVLELLTGTDLSREIRDHGPLSVGRAVHIASQICDALAAAHAKGIVHRDLKPENVFLIERGGDRDFVKVVDFGVSKFRDAADHGQSTPSHTKTGTALGTPYYMAPEQAQGQKDADHRVDVYALGVILFRALTGQHPFDDESYPMLILKICTEAPPPVRRYRTDVPPELDAVIRKMLCKQKEDRYPDVQAVKAALAPFAGIFEVPRLTGAPSTASSRAQALALAATTPATPATSPDVPSNRPPAGGRDEESEADVPPPPRGRSVPIVPLLAVLGLGVAGLAIALIATSDPDREVERASTLPEPRPMEARPLVAPGSGGIGWTWVNPLPRAMPSWYAVDAATPRMIALVGRNGAAARFRDGGLFTWPTGTDASLYGVAWAGSNEAIAVGERGTILSLNTSGEARPLDSGTTATLRAVAARTATESIVVGDAGTILRLRGGEAYKFETGTDASLLAVHVRGETVWVAGDRGTILRIDGNAVRTEPSGTEGTLRAIGGCARGDLYAAGDDGRLLRRLEDGRWERVQVPRRDPFAAIACDGDRAVVVGLRGGVILAQRNRAVELPSGFDRAWYGASAPPGEGEGTTWIVGADGRLATIARDHVRTLTGGPTVPIRDLGALGGALVAVGEWGRILRQREDGIVEGRTPTKSALASLANLTEGEIVSVGDNGAVVHILPDRARLMPSPSDAHWRDIVTDGRELLAVGTGGAFLRGTLESLRASRNAELGDLWSVAGTPADAIAVGNSGLILRVSATGSERVACSTTASLRAVVRSGDVAWAVGEGGVIVRIDGRGCAEERRGGRHLNGIGLGPNGLPLAVGDGGTTLERSATGQWQPTRLDVGEVNLRNVVRLDRYVYVIGAGGVIVRHIVLDGT